MVRGIIFGLLMVWAPVVWGAQFQDQDYQRQRAEEQRQAIQEIQRQQQRAVDQQQRQFEEQRLQQQQNEINRIGEESRRNDPLNEVFREMLRRR